MNISEPIAKRGRGRPPKTIDGGLGWRLRHFRSEAGLTLAEVAARADIAETTLSDMELRGDPVWLEILRRVAAAIQVPVELLLVASADEPREVRAAQKQATAKKAAKSRRKQAGAKPVQGG